MAKDNLFLGFGRGKVGDVVFYRAGGQQIVRALNRTPRNPRTGKQLFTRAIMATVTQAYAAGHAIFDHSFEGKSVGSECQRYFTSRNAKLLRELAAADIAEGRSPALCQARFVAPGSVTPVPNGYLISEGNYDQLLFTVASNQVSMPGLDESGQTVAEYVSANNLVAGDIYTVCYYSCSEDAFAVEPADGDQYKGQRRCMFGFLRLQVKAGLLNISVALTNPGQLFDVLATDSSLDISSFEFVVGTPLVMRLEDINASSYPIGAMGVIRSRLDSGLRSTSYMVATSAWPYCGIVSPYVQEVWSAGAISLGSSDLILEGGGSEASSAPENIIIWTDDNGRVWTNPSISSVTIGGVDYELLTVQINGSNKYIKIGDERSGQFGKFWAAPSCVDWAAAPAASFIEPELDLVNGYSTLTSIIVNLLSAGVPADVAYAVLDY